MIKASYFIRALARQYFGQWQYKEYPNFKHHFAFRYFTSSYVLPFDALTYALFMRGKRN